MRVITAWGLALVGPLVLGCSSNDSPRDEGHTSTSARSSGGRWQRWRNVHGGIGQRRCRCRRERIGWRRSFKLVPPSLTPEDFMENSGSNGLAVDNDDKLVVCDQRSHRLTRVDPTTAQMTGVILPTGNFKPNDVIVRSDDNIYFTDPDTGFYRVAPGGALTGPLQQVNRPNGIELSLDENTLYVGDVGNQTITQFAVAADGTVDDTNGKPFVTTMGTTVDGMATDCAGNLYASTQSGVEVYSSMGTYIGTVPTGESSNCTFGGPDRKTLYVTSRSVLKAVTLAVPGLPD